MQKLHIHRKEERDHAEAELAFCLACSSTLIIIRFQQNANVHSVSHYLSIYQRGV